MSSRTELYFGKKRTKGYFQHLFVESECSNGLPKPESACLSTMRIGQQCGPDEDWSVIAPDAFDGPGVMWRTDKECDKETHNTNVTVAADFFCPTVDECIHVHRCSFDGEPGRGSTRGSCLYLNFGSHVPCSLIRSSQSLRISSIESSAAVCGSSIAAW